MTFEYNQRGHQVYRLIEADAATGSARAVISEEPKTFFNYRTANGNLADSGKKFRYDIGDGREVIWMSERDGWNHLYLYDGVTGKVKNQITKGDWAVRSVIKVDEDARQILFDAGGMYPGKDPYFLHYYRINFDGTGLTPLTHADGNHNVVFSDDGTLYRRHVVARRSAAGLRAAPDEGHLARHAARKGRHRRSAGVRMEAAGSLRREGARRQDRHLGRDLPAVQFRRREEVSGHREHLCRAAGLVRAQVVLGLQRHAVDRRARLHRRPDRRHGDVEPLEGVPRRRVAEPRRRRVPRSDSLAQGGGREIPVVRHHARRHLRHVGRRAERARRPALPR